MDDVTAYMSIKRLCNFLEKYYGKDIIILLDEYDTPMQEVKRWYDGFTFGAHTDIYNPWSIASFIGKKGKYEAYWANTSGNGLVNSLMQKGNSGVKQTMEDLLQGKSFTAELDEQIVFNQLDGDDNALWSLLLATGYLKIVKLERVGIRKRKVYTLALTNMETTGMFEDMVKGWFRGGARTLLPRVCAGHDGKPCGYV